MGVQWVFREHGRAHTDARSRAILLSQGKKMEKERWGGDGCLAGAAQQVELRELKLQRKGPGGKWSDEMGRVLCGWYRSKCISGISSMLVLAHWPHNNGEILKMQKKK